MGGGIAAERVVPMLLAAAPSLVARYEAAMEYRDEEDRGEGGLHADGMPPYDLMMEFALSICASDKEGATEEFEDLFLTIERLLAEGDERTRTLLAVGLLEDIQTFATNNYNSSGVEAFHPWLGPRSRECWDYILALWEHSGNSLGGVARHGSDLHHDGTPPPWVQSSFDQDRSKDR